MKRLTLAVVMGIILTGCASLALAQDSKGETRRSLRRWSFSYSIGGVGGGPAGDLENGMIAGGFADSSGGLFSHKVIEHPFSTAGASKTLQVHYLFKGHLSVGAVWSQSEFGETLGYHSPGCYLFIDGSAETYAAVIAINSDGFRLGLGPSWNRIKAFRSDAGNPAGEKVANRLGLLFDVSLCIPARSRVFVELAAQYKFVGNMSVGPYVASYLGASATFPSTKANFNHFVIGLGLGFRL